MTKSTATDQATGAGSGSSETEHRDSETDKAPDTRAENIVDRTRPQNETHKAPDTSADNIPKIITALVDGLTFGGAVRLRGEVIDLTPELVKQSRDRTGASFLTLSEAEQVRRWGRVMFRVGDHSAALKDEAEEARIDRIQQTKFAADRDGLVALKEAWAEERAATARAKSRWKSTNTGRPQR